MKDNRNPNSTQTTGLRAFLQGRKVRYGVVTIILAVVLVVLVIASQVALTELSSRVGLSLDMTANKMYSMSEDTKTFVEGIDQDVEIVILASEYAFDLVAPQQLEIIRQYTLLNDHIRLTFEDVTYNPDYISGYDEDIQYGDILVKCGARYKWVQFNSLTLEEATDDEDVNIEYSNAEDEINSALVYVVSTETFKAAFTTGHSEDAGTEFKAFMKRNNYEVIDVNLAEQPDLSDVDLIISLGPILDFQDEELFVLDDFLDNGGDLGKSFVYMPTIKQEDSPNLDEFLTEWGIEVTDDVVYQTTTSMIYGGDIFETYATVPSTEQELGTLYASRTPGSDYKLFVPYSRRINTLFDAMGSKTTRTVLQFTGNAHLSDVLTAETWTASDNDPSGIYNAGVVCSQNVNSTASHVLVFGSYAMATAGAINNGDFINAKYLMQVMNAWVDKPVNDVIVNPVDITQPIFALTDAAASFAFWFFVVALPAVTIILGIVVFIRRRFL